MKKKERTIYKKSGKPYSEKPTPPDQLLASLHHFIEYHQPERLSRNLRKMLVTFLMFEGSTEESYFQDLLFDLEGLWAVLDEIGEGSGQRIT